MAVDGKLHAPADLLKEMAPYPLHRMLSWTQTVWMGAENNALTGMLFPDQEGLGTSLYRLRYPGPQSNIE